MQGLSSSQPAPLAPPHRLCSEQTPSRTSEHPPSREEPLSPLIQWWILTPLVCFLRSLSSLFSAIYSLCPISLFLLPPPFSVLLSFFLCFFFFLPSFHFCFAGGLSAPLVSLAAVSLPCSPRSPLPAPGTLHSGWQLEKRGGHVRRWVGER